MQTLYIWGQPVNDDGECYHIHINKPIYGHCVALSSEIIKRAEANNRRLIVSCPGASEEITPAGWVWKARRMTKVYRDPKHPMTLWQANVGASEPEKRGPVIQQLTLV